MNPAGSDATVSGLDSGGPANLSASSKGVTSVAIISQDCMEIEKSEAPRVFLSYSRQDEKLAQRLQSDLRRGGVDVWRDKEAVHAGDSLSLKVFCEGLAKSPNVIFLLTPSFLKSPWCLEEMHFAVSKRIESGQRIRTIPVIGAQVEVPPPLQHLCRVDLTNDYDGAVRSLLKAIHGVSDKQPVGGKPDYVDQLQPRIHGLSREASTLGVRLAIQEAQAEEGHERFIEASDLQKLAPDLTNLEICDAVDELYSFGLLMKPQIGAGGLQPCFLRYIRVTYRIFFLFRREIPYDPEADALRVVHFVVDKGDREVNPESIRRDLGLSKQRVNLALQYLVENELLKVPEGQWCSTGGYRWPWVAATRRTRQFAKECAS